MVGENGAVDFQIKIDGIDTLDKIRTILFRLLHL